METAQRFEWNGMFWATEITLADGRLASGPIELVFAPEGREDEPLSAAEVAIIDPALDRIDVIVAAAVEGLYGEYPSLQELYGYEGEMREELMPDIASIDGLYPLIGVTSINVHQIERDGKPYVGVMFHCTWDTEHGAGVLMNDTRVVEVGGADTAILLWIARDDAGEYPPAD